MLDFFGGLLEKGYRWAQRGPLGLSLLKISLFCLGFLILFPIFFMLAGVYAFLVIFSYSGAGKACRSCGNRSKVLNYCPECHNR